MKNPFVRGALGVVAGVVAGSVLVFLVEWLSMVGTRLARPAVRSAP